MWVWVFASVGLIACLFANWDLPGLAVAAAGVALNLLVVLLNNAMPVVSVSAGALATSHFYKTATTSTLAFLGDSMSVPLSGRFMLSAGDVLLVVGVIAFIVGWSVLPCETLRRMSIRVADAEWRQSSRAVAQRVCGTRSPSTGSSSRHAGQQR